MTMVVSPSFSSKLILSFSVVLTCIIYWAGRSRLIQYSPNSTMSGILLSSGLGLGCMICASDWREEEGVEAPTQQEGEEADTFADFCMGSALIFPIVSYVLRLSPFSIYGVICFNLFVLIIYASICWLSQNIKISRRGPTEMDKVGAAGRHSPKLSIRWRRMRPRSRPITLTVRRRV